MAPLKPVKTLYESSLDFVMLHLVDHLVKQPNNNESLRNYLLGLLHGGIREQLIARAIARYRPIEVLDLIELTMDSSVKKLRLFNTCTQYLTHEQIADLFDKLTAKNLCGLNYLYIKTHAIQENGASPTMHFLSGLHNVLSQGLAANLKVLSLHNAADNQTLSILGKFALHLTHLDVTMSWLVNDAGIRDLLLKDASDYLNTPWSDSEKCDARFVEIASRFPESRRNKTSETLCEVKIQDTNTSSLSVILLLTFAKNLKSLGGFLYSRNIGDALVKVQSWCNTPKTLPLVELWDTQLPFDKLVKIANFLPKLSSLYTRAACLPPAPNIIPPLTTLSADFDFNHSMQFPLFLEFNGASLRRLNLIDQSYSIDVAELAQYCPLLEGLSAKVTTTNGRTFSGVFSKLTYAKLRITSASTFIWMMKHADNIEKLEIHLERELGQNDTFDENVIHKIIENNFKSLQSIQCLSITMFWSPRNHNFVISCGKLSIEAAYALCLASDSLKLLGELHTWFKVTKEDVIAMAGHIQTVNWDVKLRFRDVLYPSVR